MSSCLTCPNSTFISFHLVNMSNLYIKHIKTWSKLSYLALFQRKSCQACIINWSGMTCHHGKMFKNIFHYHHLQYQTIQTSQTWSNGQNAHFWPFGSFKNAFLWSLNDFTWPGNIVEGWQTFSTITICNIKSIQQTKLKKMAKNLFLGSLDHSKMHFWVFEWSFMTW